MHPRSVAVSGWALTLGFLLSAGLWAFAPRDVAQIGSTVCGGFSAFVVFAFAVWKFIQCRELQDHNIVKSVLVLMMLAPLSTLHGQERLIHF